MIGIKIQRLAHGVGLPKPTYQSEFAAGMDVVAALRHAVLLAPGQRALIPSGICVEIPRGYELQVRPRSGLALNHGVTVLNAPGTIDSDYRGEIGVLLINHGSEPFTVTRGARIAQLILSAVAHCAWIDSEELSGTPRGDKGFGSTGLTKLQDEGVSS